jgi:hypothetical protein
MKMNNYQAIKLEDVKNLYKVRFLISRGKKAPVSFEHYQGGINVTTGEGRIKYIPYGMFAEMRLYN